MDADVTASAQTKGQLIFRDSMTFLILSSVAIALFGVTLFLFRSFEQRREEMGQQWSLRGRSALKAGQPAEAVAALRTALSYEPNERSDQLLLAEALANAGRSEEATNYFLNLRELRPGDGFVNLQLARLARKAGDASEAINDYRASIFGNWEGDGVVRRREVRLELADYLAQRGDIPAARSELLIAAGNAPNVEEIEVLFGDRLSALGDLADAAPLYKRALANDPHNAVILAKAGRLAYARRDYTEADTLLHAALAKSDRNTLSPDELTKTQTLAEVAHRVPELEISRDVPAVARAQNLVRAASIAHGRLLSCTVQSSAQLPADPTPTTPNGQTNPRALPPVALQALADRWTVARKQLNLRSLERDSVFEDAAMQLIDDTETQTAAICGKPTGDDALLLMLASPPHGGTP